MGGEYRRERELKKRAMKGKEKGGRVNEKRLHWTEAFRRVFIFSDLCVCLVRAGCS